MTDAGGVDGMTGLTLGSGMLTGRRSLTRTVAYVIATGKTRAWSGCVVPGRCWNFVGMRDTWCC